MIIKPRILVVDGYLKSARDELVAGGAMIAGEQYARMLKKIYPEITCDILFPSDAEQVLPNGTNISDYDGVAWTGCSLTVFEDNEKVRRQIEFARECFRVGVPGFGSCWAAQIAVVAAGGECRANPNGREMGVARKILLTSEGRGHPMYTSKATAFDAFTSHVDEITHIPAGTTILSGNKFTRIQSVAVNWENGVFWGLQYHPEYDLHEMARLIWCRTNKLVKLGFFKEREAAEDYVVLLEELHKDPARMDLKWLLGIDDDLLNESIRYIEVKNWLDNLVIPQMMPLRAML